MKLGSSWSLEVELGISMPVPADVLRGRGAFPEVLRGSV